MSQKHQDISQRIRPETVLAKTGKPLEEWYKIMHEFGGEQDTHKNIARFLHQEQGASAWWAQTLTVAYEYHIGRRVVNERANGFELTIQRTVAASLDKTYRYFTHTEALKLWLSPHVHIDLKIGGRFNFDDLAQLTFIKIIPKKLLRLELKILADGAINRVDIEFLGRKNMKTVIKVTNSKLRSSEEVEEMRTYWKSILTSFKAFVTKY